ncbi:MAG: sigma-70 family RNA polymerase sigma factor [Coriobacteriia bacterium]|nr:sigma-70 family RNA polymerase sigma factor [Coriobacteriia bacterium]
MQYDLEQIVREYGDLVLRLAVSNTLNRADAEDVFQEVFIRLVRSLAKIENEEHLRHWLIRTTINRCKSLFSSAPRRRELPVDELPETVEASPDNQEATPAIDALQRLPEKYRAPLHLFYCEDLPISAIAGILDSSEGTVKSLLSRGRALLRESLKEVSYA